MLCSKVIIFDPILDQILCCDFIITVIGITKFTLLIILKKNFMLHFPKIIFLLFRKVTIVTKIQVLSEIFLNHKITKVKISVIAIFKVFVLNLHFAQQGVKLSLG